MPILLEPRLIPGAQWEYSVEHVGTPEYPPGGTYSGKRLQFILATEGIYQHEQVLTETQVQEIKVRYAEVWDDLKERRSHRLEGRIVPVACP